MVLHKCHHATCWYLCPQIKDSRVVWKPPWKKNFFMFDHPVNNPYQAKPIWTVDAGILIWNLTPSRLPPGDDLKILVLVVMVVSIVTIELVRTTAISLALVQHSDITEAAHCGTWWPVVTAPTPQWWIQWARVPPPPALLTPVRHFVWASHFISWDESWLVLLSTSN